MPIVIVAALPLHGAGAEAERSRRCSPQTPRSSRSSRAIPPNSTKSTSSRALKVDARFRVKAPLGYQQVGSSGVKWYFVSVDAATSEAKVTAVPVVSSLSWPLDVNVARPHAAFQAIGRRPPGTLATRAGEVRRFPGRHHVQIHGSGGAVAVPACSRRARSRARTHDRRLRGPKRQDRRSQARCAWSSGSSSASGLFCAYNSGTTTISVTAGLVQLLAARDGAAHGDFAHRAGPFSGPALEAWSCCTTARPAEGKSAGDTTSPPGHSGRLLTQLGALPRFPPVPSPSVQPLGAEPHTRHLAPRARSGATAGSAVGATRNGQRAARGSVTRRRSRSSRYHLARAASRRVRRRPSGRKKREAREPVSLPDPARRHDRRRLVLRSCRRHSLLALLLTSRAVPRQRRSRAAFALDRPPSTNRTRLPTDGADPTLMRSRRNHRY